MSNSRPNIFSIATKELSQDGFFTWLIQWADNSNAQYDVQLHEAARNCVNYLIQRQYDTPNIQINKVGAWRQWNRIDILAEVNDDFAIIIEDKTGSGEHSQQLERYKEIATNYYKDKGFKLVFVYLKTGNDSLANLGEVREKGYAVVDRADIIGMLDSKEVTNEIYVEFKEHLFALENQTNAFKDYNTLTTEWSAAEGFYRWLQNQLQEWSHWEYVANPAGGFLGFWYHFSETTNCQIYIQLENRIGAQMKLVVKISDWSPSVNLLYELLNTLQHIAPKYGLSLVKPDKYRAGGTSTLAVVENAFYIDKSGVIDLNQFLMTLHSLEKTIDEFCQIDSC